MRFSDQKQSYPDTSVPMTSYDPWDVPASSRRLSNCSFSRIATTAPTPSRSPGAWPGSAPAGQTSWNDSETDGSESLTKLQGVESNTSNLQPQPPASPSSRVTIKQLGLSNAAVNRFRLTFDETSDAAANKNIELPKEVAPQVLGTKRPSCICGEPELPPGDGFTQLQESSNSTNLDLANTGSEIYSSTTHNCLLNSSSTHFIPVENSGVSLSPIPTLEKPQASSDNELLLLNAPGTEPEVSKSNSGHDDLNSASNMSQAERTHPKVTIRVSNSQQSFIPYLCESPTSDLVSDDQLKINDILLSHHHNNNHFIKDACFSSYPEVVCAAGCTSLAYHQHFQHPDIMDGQMFETYPADDMKMSMQDTRPLLQHQDTVSAPPIQDLYRYHVFFSHCPDDREWVEHMVAHLEAPPFNYTCAYASLQDEAEPATLQQRILCAAMLSERVVLVLSRRYVEETWFSFEKTLKQLTQMSLHNQRIMGVLLEDCDIPESLGELYFLDSSDPDFFHVFAKRLKTSKSPSLSL